jgi:hypothetical protein
VLARYPVGGPPRFAVATAMTKPGRKNLALIAKDRSVAWECGAQPQAERASCAREMACPLVWCQLNSSFYGSVQPTLDYVTDRATSASRLPPRTVRQTWTGLPVELRPP